jgi:hypothetical protein
VVLVIAESAGSLAELGTFASNNTILKALRVMIKETHDSGESFIRFGPVQRVRKSYKTAKVDHVGVYPGRDHANGKLVISSVKPHYTQIRKFISNHMVSISNSLSANTLDKKTILFYIIYLIIFLCLAARPANLYKYVMRLFPDVVESEIRNRIYCMELAGWIERLSYSGQDYFTPPSRPRSP